MPKIVSHTERRREIAAAVLDLIAAEGTASVTFRRVAAVSGYPKGVISHYFDGRDDLMMAALDLAGRRGAQRQLDITRLMTGRQALEVLLEEELPIDDRRRAESRLFVFFYAEAATSAAALEKVDGFRRKWGQLVKRTVEKCQQTGEIDPGLNAADVAADLTAYVEGVCLQMLFDDAQVERFRRSSPIREFLHRLSFPLVPPTIAAVPEEDGHQGSEDSTEQESA